ncbi:MAG: hypothetical protein FWC34_00585 [Bacteroidetes bacterium]|nr:hypothetical protein [Bacteroidota bacterium]
MKSIEVFCQTCGNINFLDNIIDKKILIRCKKCNKEFNIKNLIGNVVPNDHENTLSKKWFYQYNNGDVCLGASL